MQLPCEVGQDAESAYLSGHIAGAIYLDTGKIDWDQGGTPSWNFVPDQKLLKVLADYGINQNTTVIVYADKLAMGAYRAAVGMLYAGVNDVRVLNGGKRAWREAGFSLEKNANLPQPIATTNLHSPENKELVINIPEVKALLKQPDSVLVSIMSEDEFLGKGSGYSYYDKSGHIPGAVLAANGETPYDMLNYQDIDGTMRAYNEIASIWREAGITPDKTASFYCGTGWRASEAFFAAYLMGWKNISVFDDGWIGWSMDPENPVFGQS